MLPMSNILPSKWKKWLNGRLAFSCGSGCRSGGSSCTDEGFWIFKVNLQVGQDVSCSNHDSKHVLKIILIKKDNDLYLKTVLVKKMWTRQFSRWIHFLPTDCAVIWIFLQFFCCCHGIILFQMISYPKVVSVFFIFSLNLMEYVSQLHTYNKTCHR